MLRRGLPFLLLLAAVFLGCSGSEEAAVEPAEPTDYTVRGMFSNNGHPQPGAMSGAAARRGG